MDLDGRVALVTGGSGDLGTAISRALAAAGAHVAVAYTGNREGADATCAAVGALGRRHCAIQLDQTDPAANDRAVDEAAERMGRLDILVNNAAWNIGVPFKDLDGVTVEIWDRIFDTNVRGPFQLSRAAARHMRKQGGGRIVNIASIAGVRPSGRARPPSSTSLAASPSRWRPTSR